MPRTLRALIAAPVLALTLAACEPTGDLRCDAHVDILDEIEGHGWTIDCAPDFENRGTTDGGQTWFPIWGWADANNQTVWIWPDAVPFDPDRVEVRRGDGIGEWIVRDDHLRYLLWHELAHVSGINNEDDADAYAYCRERLGFGRGPSTKTCEELGT